MNWIKSYYATVGQHIDSSTPCCLRHAYNFPALAPAGLGIVITDNLPIVPDLKSNAAARHTMEDIKTKALLFSENATITISKV